MSTTPRSQIGLLKISTVAQLTSLSTATIKRLTALGQFPQPVQITEGRHGWVDLEVDGWLRERVAARDASKAA